MTRKELDLLLSMTTTKNDTYVSVPPSIRDLFIEKFNCKADVFEEIFPFPFIK